MARRKREPMSEGKKNISNRQIIRSRYNEQRSVRFFWQSVD